MTAEELFAMGLGLVKPWIVTSSRVENGELHIQVDFEKGAHFLGGKVHDTVPREWRHLNFWQYPTYIHARVPRLVGEDGKVFQVEVPWARPGSGFTALFEALALAMAKSMAVSEVCKLMQMDDMALWRLMELAVESARQKLDFSEVTQIGVDETSCKRGHDYITRFVDLDSSRVLFACRGKDASTLAQFAADFVRHGGNPLRVKTFSCDASSAFLFGISQNFPKSEVVLDKFHLIQMLTEATDAERKEEVGTYSQAKGFRFLVLKNPENLSEEQTQRLELFLAEEMYSKTGTVYRLRLAFQDLFKRPAENARAYLNAWIATALATGIQSLQRVAKTFRRLKEQILAWFDRKVSNGVLEGLNSVLQGAKARARGYGNPDHMILINYLLHGKLDLTPNALKRATRSKRLSTQITHTI